MNLHAPINRRRGKSKIVKIIPTIGLYDTTNRRNPKILGYKRYIFFSTIHKIKKKNGN